MKIIITSHGKLAEAFLSFGELIYGNLKQDWDFAYLGQDINEFESQLRKKLQNAHSNGEREFIIVCDIPRGTPYNIANKLSLEEEFLDSHIHLLTGLSTGIIIGLCEAQDEIKSALEQKLPIKDILKNLIEESKYIVSYIDTKKDLAFDSLEEDNEEL